MIRKTEGTVQTKRFDVTLKEATVTKAADGDCIIEGYANTSTKDRVGDVVLPQAFEKSLKTYMNNPVLLANHDWNDPCGVVLSTEITDKGLWIKARISNTRDDIKTLIREGCLRTFSIGYNEVTADYDEASKTKYIKELELLEISVVTVPANTEAMFTTAEVKQELEAAAKTEDEKSMKPAQVKEIETAPAPAPASEGQPDPAAEAAEIERLEQEAAQLEQQALDHLHSFVQTIAEACAHALDDGAEEEGKGGPGSGRHAGGGRSESDRAVQRNQNLDRSRQSLVQHVQRGNAVRQGLQRARAHRIHLEGLRSSAAARRGPKSADASTVVTKTAKNMKDFIDMVKTVVGKELNSSEVLAVCSYFINEKEEQMTKEQLIAALKAKSAKDAAPVPAAAPAAKADDAAPMADAAQGSDPMKEILAKLDAIGQAMAQILDGMAAPAADPKKDDAAPADEAKAEDKPADDQDASEEEVEKAMSELNDIEAQLSDEE